MSTRPINILEVKNRINASNTEMMASVETIWADLTGRIHNLNDQVKVLQVELEATKADNTRLRTEIAKLNGEGVKTEPDNAIEPPKNN